MCFLKIKYLPVVIHNNSTRSDSLTFIDPIVRQYFGRKDFPRIMNLNFSLFALCEFKLNHHALSFSKLMRDNLHKKAMCYLSQIAYIRYFNK